MVTSRPLSERGMTLVEIMITLVISSIIAASTFMFFAGQQRIYETHTKVLNVQQNLWAAMEVMARYARAAGTGMFGCVRPASYADVGALNGARIRSNSPSPGPLSADLALANRPATGLRAYDGSTGNASHMQWIPPLWIVNNSDPAGHPSDAALHVVPGTDIITVAFGNRTSGTDTDIELGLTLTTTDPGTPIALLGTSTGSMFRAGEFVVLLRTPDWGYGADPATDRGCTLFQITSPVQPAALPHLSSGSPWNSSSNVANMLPTEGTVGYTVGAAGVRNFGVLTWITFFVQRVDANGIPRLMMQQRQFPASDPPPASGEPVLAGDPQVLAEGIEDLQVSFACDTGTLAGANLAGLNGVLDAAPDDAGHTNDDARKTDEWWNNVPGDTLPAMNTAGFCNLPAAIRITLVARTLAPDDLIPAASDNGPPDVEDHRPATAGVRDSFRRRVLATTVYPRNNKPQ